MNFHNDRFFQSLFTFSENPFSIFLNQLLQIQRIPTSIQTLVYLMLSKNGYAKSYYSNNSVPTEQFFAVSSEKTDFLKKLLNMKIFSIKFVIKKVILIFGTRWPLLLKKMLMSPNFFWPIYTNLWTTQ